MTDFRQAPGYTFLVLSLFAPSAAFPLFGDLTLQGPSPPAGAVTPAPCHGEKRPLPNIDPAVGLSWLDHIVEDSVATTTGCLKRVNLGWEELGDGDAPQVTRLIKAGVENLSLFQNRLGDAAAVAVAATLPAARVHTLDLAHNQIGDRGGIALAQALAQAPTVRVLRLNGNQQGDATAAAFAEAIRHPDAPIDELWLTSPAISAAAAQALRDAWHDSGRDVSLLYL